MVTQTDNQPEKKQNTVAIPDEIAVLPSGGSVAYPSMVIPLVTSDERTIKLVDEVAAGGKVVGIFAQRPGVDEPPPASLYHTGTAAIIVKLFRMPDGSLRALLQGVSRIKLKELTQSEPYYKGRVEQLEDNIEDTTELEAMIRNIMALFQKVVTLAPNLPDELALAAVNISDPGSLSDFIAANINLKLEESQDILETLNVQKRIEKLAAFLNKELEILELSGKIQSQVKTEMDKTQREFFLREQLKAIQKELGEDDDHNIEINELKARIEEAHLDEEARKEAERELDRLARMPTQAAEYTTARTYLDWLIALPWDKRTRG